MSAEFFMNMKIKKQKGTAAPKATAFSRRIKIRI